MCFRYTLGWKNGMEAGRSGVWEYVQYMARGGIRKDRKMYSYIYIVWLCENDKTTQCGSKDGANNATGIAISFEHIYWISLHRFWSMGLVEGTPSDGAWVFIANSTWHFQLSSWWICVVMPHLSQTPATADIPHFTNSQRFIYKHACTFERRSCGIRTKAFGIQ